jgi:hypothetical protein
MFVLYMWEKTEPSFRGHGTSARFSNLICPYPCRNPLSQRTAKVWINFQLVHDLVGHTQPVWAVVAIEGGQYLTGALLFTCHTSV